MWRGNIWSRSGAVLGVVVAIAGASACGDEEGGDDGSDVGGSAGSAGASGSSGASGATSGGAAGNAAGGNAGSPAAGTGGSSTAGGGTGGANAGSAGMGGDDGEAGMGGADAGDGGIGGMGAGRGGMAGAGSGGVGGAGSGGTSGSAGMAGAGGAGSGGMAGGGMAGGGTSGAGGGGGTGGQEPAPINLFFSEYYEGTAATQASAVEIYNAGTAPVDLTQCSLRIYVNGSFSFSTILLITTLAPGEVYVVCSTSIGASCDLFSATTMGMVTGNDAVALYCSTGNGPEAQDTIGQTGFNPPSGQWGTGLASTADNTMRRMCSVTTGDKQGIDAFDPVFQWTGAAANSSGDLGIRFCP